MRNDAQINAVCQAVCRRFGKPSLWRSYGPTELAVSWLESCPLSSGERVLLLLAFAIYNGEGGLTVGTLLGTLSEAHLAWVASLFSSISGGADAVDRWLASVEPKEARHG